VLKQWDTVSTAYRWLGIDKVQAQHSLVLLIIMLNISSSLLFGCCVLFCLNVCSGQALRRHICNRLVGGLNSVQISL
jgi:hypothetical protein